MIETDVKTDYIKTTFSGIVCAKECGMMRKGCDVI